jgi:hypothetical protein
MYNRFVRGILSKFFLVINISYMFPEICYYCIFFDAYLGNFCFCFLNKNSFANFLEKFPKILISQE